jgi:hypothetical protein
MTVNPFSLQNHLLDDGPHFSIFLYSDLLWGYTSNAPAMTMIRQNEFPHHYVAPNIFIAPMTRIIVDPGACGFHCKIEVKETGKYEVTVRLESECQQIKQLAAEVISVNFMEIIRGGYGQNPVFAAASRCSLHASCPIPCSLIKAVEVELGMAVTKNVSITFEE